MTSESETFLRKFSKLFHNAASARRNTRVTREPQSHRLSTSVSWGSILLAFNSNKGAANNTNSERFSILLLDFLSSKLENNSYKFSSIWVFDEEYLINNDKIEEVGVKENLNIVDLTGAGDLFAAGYLHGLINNFSQIECLTKGTEMSSKIIQQIGARLN